VQEAEAGEGLCQCIYPQEAAEARNLETSEK
jgi:hypothetical protein